MINWEFSTKKTKKAGWYTGAFLVGLVLIAWGIYSRAYALTVVVFLVAGVYLLVENNSPEKLKIEVGENGIMIGELFYDYSKIDKFSIIYDNSNPVFLRIKLRGVGVKILNIPIDTLGSIKDLRDFLLQNIEEDPDGELSTGEKLINFLNL